MKPSELLKAAYAILSEGPHRWTKGAFARDEDGKSVGPSNPKATCFCGIGAIDRVALLAAAYSDSLTLLQDNSSAARRKLCVVTDGDWVEFNDSALTVYEQMLAKYREAIELAEQSELDDSPEV